MSETDLLRRFIPLAVQRLPVRLFRRQVMLAKTDDGRVMRAGVKGQADVWGFTLAGRHIELEAKSHRGSLRPEQKAWMEFCTSTGMIYMLVVADRDEAPADTVERWVSQLAALL